MLGAASRCAIVCKGIYHLKLPEADGVAWGDRILVEILRYAAAGSDAAGGAALIARGVVLLYACYSLGSVGGPRPAVQARQKHPQMRETVLHGPPRSLILPLQYPILLDLS